MKRSFYSGALAALVLLAPASSVAQQREGGKGIDPSAVEVEETDNFYFSAKLSLVDRYYYRGFELYDQAALQPSAGLFYDLGEFGTLGASLWMHVPLGDDQGSGSIVDEQGNLIEFETSNKFVELDPTISYDVALGPVYLSVGHIWYTDPHRGDPQIRVNGVAFESGPSAPDTAEVYGGFAVDTVLNPQFMVYHDYREFESEYYTLGLSQRIDSESCEGVADWFGDDFNITPFVVAGFATNAERSYNKKSGLKHINTGFRFSVPWGKFMVTPAFTYSFGFDEKDANGNERTENNFYFSIDMGYDTGFSL